MQGSEKLYTNKFFQTDIARVINKLQYNTLRKSIFKVTTTLNTRNKINISISLAIFLINFQ